jgi:uncharacterized membrane protein HdeD (DUF308 family)
MANYQYLAGAFALLILAWLAMRALKGNRERKAFDTCTLLMRGIIGIIAGLTTRILVQDSGLAHSNVTLVALPLEQGWPSLSSAGISDGGEA